MRDQRTTRPGCRVAHPGYGLAVSQRHCGLGGQIAASWSPGWIAKAYTDRQHENATPPSHLSKVVLSNCGFLRGLFMKSQRSLTALLVGSYFLWPWLAFADCDLSTYDRTPPRAIGSGLDNGTAHFQWATDVDTVDGRNWIWHYIKNLDASRGLGYRWPKANLRRALGSPLQPGKTDCNRFFVTSGFNPDDNAPIIYGTNEADQRAAVYAESRAPKAAPPAAPATPSTPVGSSSSRQPATGSVIETSYSSGGGAVESVRVAISTSEGENTGDRWKLQLEMTQNVTVGVSMIQKFLSEPQFRSILDQFRNQSMKVDVVELQKITGQDDKRALAGLFSEAELSDHANQSYLIFPNGGAPKASVSVSAPALQLISTDLILFDRDRRPYFATTVRLLVPNNAR